MDNTISKPQFSEKQKQFRVKYKDYTDKDMMIELLMSQSIQIEKLERNRSNTSKMVWFFIGIPIIIFAIAFLTGLLSAF
ncbi:hypothetical protein HX109_03715 [Galbibacter sp. BG1]|uniref:hypothetical protein n=1 Tax=Galbibacter sp. BG1 TaxID=1170699 RepID=UPI0015B9BAA5|nr:hypothetical protein [Galbibacter sp. BG1]QLE00711.1 hypothetical protein HX109_03715 [Galbibacter sp. BG1]